jgi:hypothetical protein
MVVSRATSVAMLCCAFMTKETYPLTLQRPRSRWSVRERRTPNFAVVEFYSSDWLALIDNTGTKSETNFLPTSARHQARHLPSLFSLHNTFAPTGSLIDRKLKFARNKPSITSVHALVGLSWIWKAGRCPSYPAF